MHVFSSTRKFHDNKILCETRPNYEIDMPWERNDTLHALASLSLHTPAEAAKMPALFTIVACCKSPGGAHFRVDLLTNPFMNPLTQQESIATVAARPWFYEFDLPDGQRTKSYLPAGVSQIHTTRLEMLLSALAPVVQGDWAGNSIIDVACHQGYFASHLARKGSAVLAIDARPEHIADTELIARAYGLTNLTAAKHDINELRPGDLGQFDVSLMLGLLYHIENPVGAIRLARALTRKVCVIETQVVPNMTGIVDWGSYQFQRPMVASFGIIDETAETHAPEASTTGICITPSYEALLFMMKKLGFTRVERVAVPAGGYEQLASGKRVMVVGYVD